MFEVEGGSRAAAPKGSMTYAFTHMGNFLLLLLAIGIWVLGLWAGFGLRGWDLGLEAGIWASRLGFESGREGTDGGEGGGGEISPMCESIGHRPLRGRCPAPSLNFNHNLLRQGTGTADHLTLLRLLFLYQHVISKQIDLEP